MKKEKEKDNNDISTGKKIIRFSLFIILIIIILLLHSCFRFETINNLEPTGNVDIFDIVIDKKCCNHNKCDCKCNKENKNIDNNKSVFNDSSSKTKSSKKSNKKVKDKDDIKDKDDVDDTDDEEEEIEKALIYDDTSGEYNNTSKLNIFTNPAYKFKKVIAPTSSNVYQFVVRNNNIFDITYNLKMIEYNEHSINMKYKLKKDGVYVAGSNDSWVRYDDLHLEGLYLSAKDKHVYQLEWKWFESSNDTYIGKIRDTYSLNISFDGAQVE